MLVYVAFFGWGRAYGLGVVVGEAAGVGLLAQQGDDGVELAAEHRALGGDPRLEHQDGHVRLVGRDGCLEPLRDVLVVRGVDVAHGGGKARVFEVEILVHVAVSRRVSRGSNSGGQARHTPDGRPRRGDWSEGG